MTVKMWLTWHPGSKVLSLQVTLARQKVLGNCSQSKSLSQSPSDLCFHHQLSSGIFMLKTCPHEQHCIIRIKLCMYVSPKVNVCFTCTIRSFIMQIEKMCTIQLTFIVQYSVKKRSNDYKQKEEEKRKRKQTWTANHISPSIFENLPSKKQRNKKKQGQKRNTAECIQHIVCLFKRTQMFVL